MFYECLYRESGLNLSLRGSGVFDRGNPVFSLFTPGPSKGPRTLIGFVEKKIAG